MYLEKSLQQAARRGSTPKLNKGYHLLLTKSCMLLLIFFLIYLIIVLLYLIWFSWNYTLKHIGKFLQPLRTYELRYFYFMVFWLFLRKILHMPNIDNEI